LAEPKSSNVGSASHLGERKVVSESHFIYDYTFRRVPIPIMCYMAIADSKAEHPTECAAKLALDKLQEIIEPAVVAEEECTSKHMERLIKESLSEVSEYLFNLSQSEKNPETRHATLTMVLADRKKAYIGHIGSGRIYLMHDERLYDLTPTGELSAITVPETPTLFSLPAGEEITKEPAETEAQYLGESVQVRIGYNEVDISPGDVIILASDGLWSVVSEDEILENLSSALNVQRSASQLTRLAFSRDSSSNATMVAWQYFVPGQRTTLTERELRSRKRKERAVDTLIVMLLALILLGIFAIGVALGWRITDAFRKPQKETKKVEKKVAEKKTVQKNVENTEVQTSAPQVTAPKTAIVKGVGVRMRASPDPKGDIVGILQNGQTVTVLGSTIGTDSATWTKARGKVRSGGKEIEGEGYIRNDFLTFP